MLRLRTTTTLSLLVLGASIAVTQWLSDQTGSSAEPVRHSMHHLAAHPAAASHLAHHSHPGSHHVPVHAQPHYVSASAIASAGDKVEWVPVSMPVSSIPFARMRHHDAGNLVLHLVVDGQGQVTQVSLVQSSGDAVLDADALTIARQWRFAVPPDHPQGFSGDLPLSFTAANAQFAQTP
ncbi:energy transducer TonB [Dyella flava]|uniref:Energy transducer TonB n=1 Tax=Dyella flava TaxID=1920170 RepID=A0ABS2K0A5_9GAMM|nr:energy transducer TonB [Dyella flava]MBM7124167.1 energy transducer TonB [Dyella flava]GLQ50067.1 hypothetical protein GCM10010872_15160 [Dyella flava]